MPVPHTTGNFGDLIDPRFQRVFHEQYQQLPDVLPMLYTFPPDNGRADTRWTQVGTLGNFTEFSGTVGYQSQAQGFDTTQTHVEYANGIQVERTLFDYDQYNIMDQRPKALAQSAFRTRQTHGASLFNTGFTVGGLGTWMTGGDGLALFSNSHTTNSGASTASGFDNLGTAALTSAAVAANRISMVDFRGDQAERISITPDEIWIPNNLFEQAFEIIKSSHNPANANNARNVHEGQYKVIEWNYLNVDAANWFMADSQLRAQSVYFVDSQPIEFAMVEDFDTLVAKWRGYMRYSPAYSDWRWGFGANVS